MEKKSRLAAHPTSHELIETDTLRPRGAPRGLLHFYALLSIARKPMRGYDLMREIEVKTEGAWRPGPGAVYPMLQKLAKQGYIRAGKKASERATQVIYEITPAGLQHIANAKQTMKSSTERLNLMSSLFIDLMEPDDLVRFSLGSFELQIELIHTIVESARSGLTDQDKLFVLRQYRLNLERELGRAVSLLKALDAKVASAQEGTA
jgi:DNA-binding PadR family transcriptional regulator